MNAQIDWLSLWSRNNSEFYNLYAQRIQGAEPIGKNAGNVYDLGNNLFGRLRIGGGANFKNIIDIFISLNDERIPLGYLEFFPRSSALPDYCTLFKFENQCLYRWKPNELYQVIGILTSAGIFTPNDLKVSQLDLCGDAQQHWLCTNGLPIPTGVMIHRLATGEYCRVRKGRQKKGNFDFHHDKTAGTGWGTNRGGMSWDTIKFGSSQSAVNVKLYNKTKEIPVHGKEYIRDSWTMETKIREQQGEDVYRLEVSMKGGATELRFTDDNGKQYDSKTIDFLRSQKAIDAFYNAAVEHYFNVRIPDNARIDRSTKLEQIDANTSREIDFTTDIENKARVVKRAYLKDRSSYTTVKIRAKFLAQEAAHARNGGLSKNAADQIFSVYLRYRNNLTEDDRRRFDKVATDTQSIAIEKLNF